MQQNMDPRQAGIDWGQFRESQREPSRVSVASALALDEIARREGLTVSAEEVDKEIERFAARAGRTQPHCVPNSKKKAVSPDSPQAFGGRRRVDLVLSRARIL
jgi:FKBP-type peptidyl-prolyl cis-trans isomerase (trigger factor)